jgi:hypothetical protein
MNKEKKKANPTFKSCVLQILKIAQLCQEIAFLFAYAVNVNSILSYHSLLHIPSELECYFLPSSPSTIPCILSVFPPSERKFYP